MKRVHIQYASAEGGETLSISTHSLEVKDMDGLRYVVNMTHADSSTAAECILIGNW